MRGWPAGPPLAALPLAAPLLAALLLAVLPARAGGPEVWNAMYDARLLESVDRDPGAAQDSYETLLQHLAVDDELRGQLLVDLARARFDLGEVEGARAALVEAAADPRVGARARAWLVQLAAWEQRVQDVPVVLGFEDGAAPFVLGWSAAAEASLVGGPEGLAWTTIVRDGRDDYVLAAIEPPGPLVEVRLRLRADTFPMHLRVLLEDASGARWTAPVAELPVDVPQELALVVADLLPAGMLTGTDRPDPERIRVIMLQDVTAFHSGDRGAARVVVEELSIR